jgi:class 3 adenylate cyclase
MKDSQTDNDPEKLRKELKKLRLESKLQKSLSGELERQKLVAVEAQELALAKTKKLDQMVKKLGMESRLRKSLSDEFERQKEIAVEAQELALEKKTEIEAISNQLSKYLSPQLFQAIFSGDQQVDIASQRKKLTIFFSDIVGFTHLSDSMESEEITAMLNYYLTEMSLIAFEYGGTIDKYIGDAILIFFGDPETAGAKEDALKCVNMAIAMQTKMRALADQWAAKCGLKEPLQIRVGISTGYCTVGNFGSEDRLDYTVIGGQVNLASRLESIAKPGAVLISFDTYSQILKDINCIEMETVHVKGINEGVRTFEVVLDAVDRVEIVDMKTKNTKCSIDINGLELEEIDQLTKFVQEAKKRIR